MSGVSADCGAQKYREAVLGPIEQSPCLISLLLCSQGKLDKRLPISLSSKDEGGTNARMISAEALIVIALINFKDGFFNKGLLSSKG